MTHGRRPWLRWTLRIAGGLLILVVLVTFAAVLWIRSELRASLPQLDGQIAVAGLSSEVLIERDELGVPTLRASNRLDLARATGLLHAQERFFQMDLLRRRAAGELAELFGPPAVAADRDMRLHRFRRIAERNVEQSTSRERALLQAYADGVNTGLAALGSRPPEYLLLQANPAPWLPEDCVLVVLAMYTTLQSNDGARESSIGLMADLLPAELYEFLTPRGTEWDAPIVGKPLATPPVPGPEVVDLRRQGTEQTASRPGSEIASETVAGSNNWAVAGRRTFNGSALLANDMHLPLGMPNIWYRASFVWTESDSALEQNRVTGVTLPGTLSIIVGSNGHVAWGFTNSQGDWSDLVIIDIDPDDDERYLTPEGALTFERHEERIRVKGGPDETVEVVSTVWGPVLDRDHRGRPRVLRWIAYDPGAADMGILNLETAKGIEEAMLIANTSGIPTQNFVAADRTGRIGWTLMGPMPHRVGFDGSVPTSWASGVRRWDRPLALEEYPRVFDPESDRLWTGNNRVVGGEMLEQIGNGGSALGARARQIRDGLMLVERATPRDMLAVQLDDRALFLERWRDLALRTLTPEALAGNPRRAEFRRTIEDDWSGRASVASVGYRMVRAFRRFLAQQVFGTLTRACEQAGEDFNFFRAGQWEGPLWKLVDERPVHLLDPRHRDWDEQLLAAVDEALDYFLDDSETSLATKTWGDRNTVRIRHPISRAVPPLARWLDVPAEPLPGDSDMPRVQSVGFGASQRMVVSPGFEHEGILHMPGGQSGHPLSPYYRKGHEAWAVGEPTPFLPGVPVHELLLQTGG